MKAVAFIPARGGSRGIPGKNKKMFCGKPLVQWSIDQAKESKLFDKIVVSSDDDDILKIAKDCGVDSHDRSIDLSGDATSLDDVLYAYFSEEDNKCEYISMLQPTSPLRSVQDLKDSYKFIQQKRYWSVVGVTWNPMMGWIKHAAKQGGKMTNATLYLINDRPNRQNRENFFLENGAIYWVKWSILMNLKNRIGAPSKAHIYEMPPERSLDLDDEFDWFLAERAYEYKHA